MNGHFNKWYWDKRIAAYKGMRLDSYRMSYRNINSKWIVELNARAKTMK